MFYRMRTRISPHLGSCFRWTLEQPNLDRAWRQESGGGEEPASGYAEA